MKKRHIPTTKEGMKIFQFIPRVFHVKHRASKRCVQRLIFEALLIEGRLQQDQWEDKETGQKRSKLKVVGESMQLLGSRDGAGGGGGEGAPRQQSAPSYNAGPPQGDVAPSQQAAPATRPPEESFYDSPGTDGDVPF